MNGQVRMFWLSDKKRPTDFSVLAKDAKIWKYEIYSGRWCNLAQARCRGELFEMPVAVTGAVKG